MSALHSSLHRLIDNNEIPRFKKICTSKKMEARSKRATMKKQEEASPLKPGRTQIVQADFVQDSGGGGGLGEGHDLSMSDARVNQSPLLCSTPPHRSHADITFQSSLFLSLLFSLEKERLKE
ncbi:hypothetical protein OIU84_007570 [Salix udensis]|uniref:Uncharacterized protein n=1 Tax=Salix udensis TaxID=889485 RepID=A0AAD6JT49_9ROSI|nr:hypothetical protein OIU84_007570 [Salix udensis]